MIATTTSGDVVQHLQKMLHLISEARHQMEALEMCVKEIAVETKIIIPIKKGDR